MWVYATHNVHLEYDKNRSFHCHEPSILWLQLSILTDTHKPFSAIQQLQNQHQSLVLSDPNSKQDISEEYKCLSPHNNQLWLYASSIHLHCTFLSHLIPFILLLLYHRYPCSFPFTDIILLNSYKCTLHVPVFSILDIKVVSVLFLCPLVSVSQPHYYYWFASNFSSNAKSILHWVITYLWFTHTSLSIHSRVSNSKTTPCLSTLRCRTLWT